MRIPPSLRRAAIVAPLILLVTLGLIWQLRDSPHSHVVRSKPSATTISENSNAGAEVVEANSDGATAKDQESQTPGASIASSTPPDKTPPGSSAPMPVQATNGPPEISTRALAAQGKTVADILRDSDMSDPEVRARKVAELRLLGKLQKDAVIDRANQLGIPLRIDGPGHKVSILYEIRGDEPLYRTTLNANAAISTGANLIAQAPYSLDGTGLKIGIWDGGSVRNTHQELTGRVTKKDPSAAVDDHATHVAGTIGATGIQSAAKGMAPMVNIDSYDWDFDYDEMTAAGSASSGDVSHIPLSNHSYGYDALTADMGRYETEAAAVDAIAVSLPYYLIFWAAGNEQDLLTAKGGYQSITFNGLAKNIMTIGAVDDAVQAGVRFPANGTIAYFSSLGPCDDGRIKPDVVANGINLYSSVATGNTAYDGTYSGTSMATPNALGSSVLLEELYAREYSGQRMRASMLKALLIHTASDIGNPGPDYKFGWGLIDVKSASDLILANKASIAAPKMIEDAISTANPTKTHTFIWDGVSPIRATVCWTDPVATAQTAADSRVPNLKNNLDAKITAPDSTTNYSPYVMPFVGTWTQASMALNATTGKNNVDNVEQVDLATPSQTGTYTVTISLDGALTGGSQAYSLIITGGTEIESNPPPNLALTSPADGSSYLPGVAVTVSATATDMTIGGAAGAVSQVEFFAGNSSIGIDTTAPYSVTWTPSSGGTYAITAKATDNEAAVSTSTAASISVLTGNGSPVLSSFTPGSGAAGALVILSGTNFSEITSVTFNGVEASYTVDSLGQITATVPALARTGIITVTNGHGTGTGTTNFIVLQSPVLISQIYGGGGNTGATYKQDYIELYNRSEATVSVTGWSVQYASSSGTSWTAINLSGPIAPGKHFLVGLGNGGNVGSAIPTPDATGSINLSSSSGKIALRNSTTAFSGSSPSGVSSLQDLVGYGATNAFEGSAAAPGHTATTALFRAGSGVTDTGDNSNDFSTAAPNPRNLASVPTGTPVISSATTATGTAGTAFTYQIIASGTPASYGASGLPSGLIVNTTTGAITGSPVAAAAASVTLSATNTTGTGYAPLILTINPAAGGAGLFSEDMGTPTNTTAIASNGFQNTHLTFTGTADVRNTTVSTVSTGYTGASGGGNVFITGTVGKYFEISGINTSGYTNLSLSLGHHKSTTTGNNELMVEVSGDGTNFTPLTYSRTAGPNTTVWTKITPTGTIPSVANLHIRFRQTSTTTQFRIDDVVLSGTPTNVGTTYSSWLASYNVGVLTALGDDFDHDGLPNGIENILGTAPDATNPGLSLVSFTGNMLVFRHTRSNSIAADLTASYEWSSNLTTWQPSATTVGSITVTIASSTITDNSAPDNDLVEVTATVTGTSTSRIFVRLKATQP
jgi:hypothetical protein